MNDESRDERLEREHVARAQRNAYWRSVRLRSEAPNELRDSASSGRQKEKSTDALGMVNRVTRILTGFPVW